MALFRIIDEAKRPLPDPIVSEWRAQRHEHQTRESVSALPPRAVFKVMRGQKNPQ